MSDCIPKKDFLGIGVGRTYTLAAILTGLGLIVFGVIGLFLKVSDSISLIYVGAGLFGSGGGVKVGQAIAERPRTDGYPVYQNSSMGVPEK